MGEIMASAVDGLAQAERLLVGALMAGLNYSYSDFGFNGQEVVGGPQKVGGNNRSRIVLPVILIRLNDICRVLSGRSATPRILMSPSSRAPCFCCNRRGVRGDTVTVNIVRMALAVGILTASGSQTSLAAVVARQHGKVFLVACPDLVRRHCRLSKPLLETDDVPSLDGNTAAIDAGKLTPVTERPKKTFAVIAGLRIAAAAQAVGSGTSPGP
jgi:hypothetical protein